MKSDANCVTNCVTTTQRLNNKMVKSSILLFKSRLLIMLATAMLLQACGGETEQSNALRTPVTTHAETMELQSVDIDARYVTSGLVSSDHRVSISSRVSGYIRKLSVREGDRVQKGQLLLRVDPVNAKQSLIQADADLADAKADKQRYEALYRDHAVSKQQLDRVLLRYKVASSRVAQARNQLGFSEVRSPVDGVVVEKRLSKGDLAQPGAAILTLEDPSSLLVNTYVSEQFVSRIHVGDSVNVEVTSINRRIPGIVRQVVEAADAVSHQFQVKIALQDKALHPGMFAQVGFSIGVRRALMVPEAAIISRSGLHGVYVSDADDIIHYRQIRAGLHNAGQIEVLAGLRDGDVIAWHGKPALKSGMKLAR